MRILVPAFLLLAACSENTITYNPNPEREPQPGSITGRVCDASGRSWLADALAYTNIYNDDGYIVDVRQAYSDRDGWWVLDGLAPDREYTVYVQDGSSVLGQETVFVADGEDVRLEEPDCFDPLSLNIALVTGDYDDIQLVLEAMGFANYRLVNGLDKGVLTDFLVDPENLAPYDIVFFNGGHVEKGIIYDDNPSNEVPKQVIANLQAYVAGGGRVLASDWAYDVIERAWPDAVDFLGDDRVPNAAQLGEYDLVDAGVTDEALAAYLGSNRIEIEYDLPVWPPITKVEPWVSEHVKGTIRYREGTGEYTLASSPMLVSFTSQNGRVGFATFRVAANASTDMTLVLQYMLHRL